MAIEKLKFVNIMGPLPQLDNAIAQCFEFGSYHPENASELIKGVKGFAPVTDSNPFTAPLAAATELLKKAGLASPCAQSCTIDFTESTAFINEALAHLSKLGAQIDSERELIDGDDKILAQISPMLGLHIPLSNVFNLEYVKFRFGKMPRESYEKLNFGSEGRMFIYMPSSIEPDYVWGMYFAPRSVIESADSTFASLHFERIRIDARADGIPSDVYDILVEEEKTLSKELSELEAEKSEYIEKHREHMLEVFSAFSYENSLFECRRLSMRTANNFYSCGWVPTDKSSEFEKHIERLPGVSCIEENPEESKTLPPAPTRLKNNWFVRPFETFVRMYGLPRYGEIDPSPLVAITYCIIFGLMFGDVGQGAVLVLIGLLMSKLKKMEFGKIIATVGVFAMAGGVLFGSVFGYENIIPGLHPLEDANVFNICMFASIGFGIILIVTSIVFNIINGIKSKNYTESIFGNNGIAGVVFYIAVILGVLGMFGFGKSVLSVPYIIVFVLLPLVVIFLKGPLGKLVKREKGVIPKNKGEYILENFFELFDVLLSYITNTISFVRIAAFALNHAGMMMFVFILANMGTSQNMLVVIIGNIVVIGLEGLIVGIQVLRLEFYEIFSHFFTGEGREFQPINSVLKK